MTSTCECNSLDVWRLFDDRLLPFHEHSAHGEPPTVLVIAPA